MIRTSRIPRTLLSSVLLRARSTRPFVSSLILPRSTAHQTPYISPILSIADSLVPKCSSCGVKLQSTDSSKEGYYKVASEPIKKQRPLDNVFEKYSKHLSEEDRKLLLNGADDTVPTLQSEVRSQQRAKAKEAKVQCFRCRNVNYKSSFDLSQFPIEPVSEVLEQIPPGAPIIYVISALDFPMSINNEIFRYRSAKSIHFVVTKTDLLFAKKESLNKYGLRFYQDYFERTYGVPRENVSCMSGTSDWNNVDLLDEIPDGSYIIGTVNSGKSTLVQSLLHAAQKKKSDLPNSRRDREMQKINDRLISQGKKPLSYASLIRQNIKQINAFKQQNGPGVSYMPGFTRGVLPFPLDNHKMVYDVPGFSNNQNTRLYDIMGPQAIKQLLKGKKVHKTGMYNSHYETVKAGQVLTVGGLFFLQVPEGAMLQVRNCINHKPHVFKNMEKALDVFRNQADSDAMRDTFLVDPRKAQLEKYIVPTFHGKKDIVFQFLGHIVITPTGAKTASDPFTIYIPKGIEAILRQPITNYITTSLSGRDANGNPLRKEHWVTKSTKEVKRWTGKIPFYTDLIPATASSDKSDVQVMEEFVQQYETQVGIGEQEQDSETSEYSKWYQKR